MGKCIGCSGCKHHKSTFVDKFKATCEIGHNDKVELWWKNNGHKIREVDTFDVYDCYEDTEYNKKLQDMINDCDKILKLLKNE